MSAKYIEISQRLSQRIQEGEWKAGEKLPSLRDLCHLEHVSLMTAMSIYSYLEQKGFIRAKPRSGFVVRTQVPAIQEHPAFDESEGAAEMSRDSIIQTILRRGHDDQFQSFGAGTMSPAFLPVKALQRMGKQILHHVPESLIQYSTPPGLLSLRKILATRLNNRGCSFHAKDLMLTTGCMEALQLCLSHLLKPHDRVLVETPTFFSLLTLFHDLQVEVIEAPIHPQHGLLPKTLEEYLSLYHPKLVVLIPNFNNPTGALIPEQNKEAIVRLLEQTQTPCLEDDIYAELSFSEEKPRPLMAYARNSHFFLVSSISKSLAPGLRVGYVATRSSVEPLCKLKAARTISNATYSEHLVSEYFQAGLFDRNLRRLTQKIQNSLHHFQHTIMDSFPKGTRIGDPAGGFFLWVELPRQISSIDLFRLCIKEKLVFSPGTIFSECDCFRHFIRLNCGVEWNSTVEQALKRIGSLAKELSASSSN